MHRRILTVLIVLALLAGCAAPAGETPPEGVQQSDGIARQELVFVLDRYVDAVLAEAAQGFSERLETLTDGSVVVKITYSADAQADFTAGKAQFAYIDGARDNDFCAGFSFLSDPVRYKDYYAFTMGLNSESVLTALDDRLSGHRDAVLLAAFYRGAKQMLSVYAPVGGNLLIMSEGDPDYFGEADIPTEDVAAVRGDSDGIDELLAKYGMITSVESDADKRLELLLKGEAMIAEFSVPELEDVAPSVGGLYFLTTNHGIVPLWLAMSGRTRELLTPYESAAVTEACAGMFSVIDKHYLLRENKAAASLRENGAVIGRSFDGLSQTAMRLDTEDNSLDYFKIDLLGILKNMT